MALHGAVLKSMRIRGHRCPLIGRLALLNDPLLFAFEQINGERTQHQSLFFDIVWQSQVSMSPVDIGVADEVGRYFRPLSHTFAATL